jgi:2-haloacid dehalogenase
VIKLKRLEYFMIKNIFLDLDDTLLDFHRGEGVAIEKTLRAFDIEPTEAVIAVYRECNRFCWGALERGEMTRDDVLTHRFEMVFARLGVNADSERVQYVYERNLANEAFFVDGAIDLLEYLSERYDLYMTTNGTAFVQERRIAKSGVARYFKDIFISEKMGAHKPSSEYFDACFKRIPGAKRDETIIIGDSLTSDILGGINAGIHTCHFLYSGAVKYDKIVPEYVASTLGEIPEIIGKI